MVPAQLELVRPGRHRRELRRPGYTPVVGDWNGDGIDTIGVYVNGWWYLRNAASGGSPSNIVNYGAAGYAPVVGRWAADGPSGIGVIIPS